MDYESQIKKLIEENTLEQAALYSTSFYNIHNCELKYVKIDSVNYIENLSIFCDYFKRSELHVIQFVKQRLGLKVYSTTYKGVLLYGFKSSSKNRIQIQQKFNTYVNNINCKTCKSRFTIIKEESKVCTSCGSVQ